MSDAVQSDSRRFGRAFARPGAVSLAIYRYGRWATHRRNPFARRIANLGYGLMKLLVLNITKVWIAPQTVIGKDFHLINTEGSLSIHPDAIIGDRVSVMHNVTIGTNMREGAPTIGNDVFIGVNSTVLGPIHIGDRVRIGANTSVTTNVPADSVAIGSPARIYPSLPAMTARQGKPEA